MKKLVLQFSIVAVSIFVLPGCVKDSLKSTYTFFVPVYKSKPAVWADIKSSSPQPLQNTGKLFLYGNYIFLNEINKGVHIINNSNPAAPVNTGFIHIPGNIDIAVKNNTLYADIFTDMVTLDISNTANIVLKKVTPNVFPERSYDSGVMLDTTKYIIDWKLQQTTSKADFETLRSAGQPMIFNTLQSGSFANGISKANGVSGSMARFTIVNNYLYTVGQASLTSFNINDNENPVKENVKSLGWNIETIYPFKDKLFIGGQTGMYIYSIANPANPTFQGDFLHACFNDPVIADDQYAYVTLRANTQANACRGGVAAQRNELDIVNVSNVLQPALVKIYDMAGPKGLSKDGDYLFICDGIAGLKIYNAANVQNLQLIKTIGNITPSDVICISGHAIVVADEGIYQYDYSNIGNIKMISKITISKN